MSLYFTLHLITISFPLVRSFEYRVKYYQKWAPLFKAIAITAAFFIAWDVIFTNLGVWGFNAKYLSGIYLINLPVEEWLFFITVPFASIFIYENVVYFLPEGFSWTIARNISVGLAAIILVVALFNWEKYYTFYNLTGTAIILLFVSLYSKPRYLPHFLIAYLFVLIPFFCVNGVLTGSFIEEPVVWYNDAENLGIRIGTIPIEDTMYGFFLLLMNVSLYEHFKSKLTIGK